MRHEIGDPGWKLARGQAGNVRGRDFTQEHGNGRHRHEHEGYEADRPTDRFPRCIDAGGGADAGEQCRLAGHACHDRENRHDERALPDAGKGRREAAGRRLEAGPRQIEGEEIGYDVGNALGNLETQDRARDPAMAELRHRELSHQHGSDRDRDQHGEHHQNSLRGAGPAQRTQAATDEHENDQCRDRDGQRDWRHLREPAPGHQCDFQLGDDHQQQWDAHDGRRDDAGTRAREPQTQVSRQG